jgi:negative regulator of sigma E activity
MMELITALADGEANESDKQAFAEAVQKNPALQQALERERRLKNLIAERCAKVPVPVHLNERIRSAIKAEAAGNPIADRSDNRAVGSIAGRSGKNAKTGRSGKSYLYTLMGIAATVLLAVSIYLFRSDTPNRMQIVEDLVYEHYTNHGGSLLPVSFASENTGHAQEILHHNYDIELIIPELEGAAFAGVVYAEFAKDFHTPLLEYTVDYGDNIYIFAFCLDQLSKHDILDRDDIAASRIKDINDVYIKEIGGKHVVSWKWHDVWYAAISDHDGQTLASMLPRR